MALFLALLLALCFAFVFALLFALLFALCVDSLVALLVVCLMMCLLVCPCQLVFQEETVTVHAWFLGVAAFLVLVVVLVADAAVSLANVGSKRTTRTTKRRIVKTRNTRKRRMKQREKPTSRPRQSVLPG